MRIVIDLQGAQTDSRFRGIGRYAMNFAKALVRNRDGHEIIIALNALFPDTIGPIREMFRDALPPQNVLVWDAPAPVAEHDPANRGRRGAAELVREAVLASLNPDIVHLTSLFEGYVDDAVTSIGRLEAGFPVSVTLYDLIPFLNQDEYLRSNETYADHYLRKIDHLRRAHTLLAISRSAGQEAVDRLGWEPDRVIAVGTGSDGRFGKTNIPTARERALRARFGLEHPFFMYVSAPDAHKNHRRLIEAYARLPADIRAVHRLALVGRFSKDDRAAFERHAAGCGLSPGELVLTGGVSDEDLNALYNLSKGFIMPSWHEGFGLPALEAMQCGRAVIGSGTSSLPEVIGREDALFDPFDVDDIARAIGRLAADDVWRAALETHSVSHAAVFDWNNVARRALTAFQDIHSSWTRPIPGAAVSRRPRLAFVSPLPPARSGISDYSAELLPELSRHYEIEVIVDQPEVKDPFVHASFPIRSIDWFHNHADEFERIVYQFGNSPFHRHMFIALEDHPGVVVLHDFFLSAAQADRQFSGWTPHALTEALQVSHGYPAIRDIGAGGEDVSAAVQTCPTNLPVLQDAIGVIVHSEHARRLGQYWYGATASSDWTLVPLLRAPSTGPMRETARVALGLAPDDLIVCSFGFLDPVKLNHRLLAAWFASPLSANPRARLVFVGENHGGAYGEALRRQIDQAGSSGRIHITGWSDATMFRQYLAAADIGVQLRSGSRGELSAAALDCMNHGLATIVNAHGAMADLDPTGVRILPDAFTDAELVAALTDLADERDHRVALGQRARSIIRTRHAPRACAAQYAEAIEAAYERADSGLHRLTRALRRLRPAPEDGPRLATALARNFPATPRRPQLLVDVSALVRTDLKTGIERVVRAILREWLDQPPAGWQVEPVYATETSSGYRYARQFTSRFLGIPDTWTEDTVAEAWQGDVFMGLDFHPHIIAAQQDFLSDWHNRGVGIWFLLYDLLPVSMPQFFPEGTAVVHQSWLETVSRFDGVICISHAVADELRAWLQAERITRGRPPRIEWAHIGADIGQSVPTTGLPDDSETVLATLRSRPSFLMVGTIEPRKGYLQAIRAFELLWQENADINLVIVGAEGWKPLPDVQRRTIPLIVETIRNHPERGRRLVWLEGISDEYLKRVYAASTCLIAGSEGEGFGLPLIEAAQHGLPILARDIPVFREVAGDYAVYFSGLDAADLATAVRDWLARHAAGNVPSTTAMPWQAWAQSAGKILECIGLASELRRPEH